MSFVTAKSKISGEPKSFPLESHTEKKQGRHRALSPSHLADAMALMDAVIIIGAAVIAKHIYINGFLGDPGGFFGGGQATIGFAKLGTVLAIACFFIFRQLGLYKLAVLFEPLVRIRQVLLGLALGFLCVLALLFLLKASQDYSRGWLLTWYSLSAFTLIVGRAMAGYFARRLQLHESFKTRVALYGSGMELQKARETLQRGSRNLNVVGSFAPEQCAHQIEVSGGLEALISFGKNNNCDQVVITLPLSAREQIEEAVCKLSVLPVDLILMPDLDPIPVNIRDCTVIGSLPVFRVQRRPLSDRQYLAKSVVDYLIGAVGLVFLAPVFLLVAIAIKLESPGPVFFVQRRHGYNHKIIRVFKFRTMNVTEDDGEIRQARADDERVTRVGSLLRRTSIDELPQLWNVLRGDMSLVGPRPHALSHNALYANLWTYYSNRHRVKPGITGWAQVNGLRGETSNPEDMRKRAVYDLHYIENWSLLFDFEILLRTVAIVLTGRNAN